MKVAKFGGSSLSCATQIRKVATIIQNNPNIKAVVVSAPGKRHDDDTKVTDLLIALYEAKQRQSGVDFALHAILERYQSIVSDLALSADLMDTFEHTLTHYLRHITEPARLLDALKACGEDFNAQLVSAYLTQIGLNARYVSPLEAGIRVSDTPSNARLLDSSYDTIAQLKEAQELLIIPGFFGYSLAGDIVTFSRGGSDISGAIIARGLDVDLYENYTDQTFIYAAHPGKIKHPYAVKEITYQEMRELAYAGFGIFHDEALAPVYEKNIPVMIRNTNDPEVEGTKIVSKRELNPEMPVVGISSDAGFTSITLRKYLLNREQGFIRRLLQLLETHDIAIEQLPSGIDHLSVIMRSNQFDDAKLQRVLADIQAELQPESIEVEHDLSTIVIVGEGMRNAIGIASKATTALAQNNVNIHMISQGASEVSMIFVIPKADEQKALESLYATYF
ncbi:MAG: aspartate kinase [Aerococcaceae bacterium]|nr:aspartate kinase [Aerococcaceae bacterium]